MRARPLAAAALLLAGCGDLDSTTPIEIAEAIQICLPHSGLARMRTESKFIGRTDGLGYKTVRETTIFCGDGRVFSMYLRHNDAFPKSGK